MRHLWIKTPESALIHVSSEFLSEYTDVYLQGKKARLAVETGLHFGSRYPGHPDTSMVYDVLPDTFLSRITNRDDFIGALLFDRWVSNTDEPQAIFIPQISLPGEFGGVRFEALMIDRGFAFGGPDWLLRDSPIRGLHRQRAVYDGLCGISDCEPWLARIKALQDDYLYGIVETIPKCWLEAAAAGLLDRLVRELLNGRSRVANSIVTSAKSDERPFRNWTNSTAGQPSGSAGEVLAGEGAEKSVRIARANGA
jgi:hypothetical protein